MCDRIEPSQSTAVYRLTTHVARKAPFISNRRLCDKIGPLVDGVLCCGEVEMASKQRFGLPFFNVVIKERSGIYAIVNTKNGNHYVGQSIDLAKRRISHLKDLQSGRHCNPYLQNSFDFHGGVNFAFTILEYVPNCDELNDRERYWIETIHKDHKLYNVVLDPDKWIKVQWAHELDKPATWQYTTEEERPDWHGWVYGHGKNPQTRR